MFRYDIPDREARSRPGQAASWYRSQSYLEGGGEGRETSQPTIWDRS